MSYTVFVIGNIASGKSTACRYLASRGARHIDLDQLAKSLYVPDSALVQAIADEFGWDVLDASGGIRTSVLAERAFTTPESIEALNSLVHPALLDLLSNLLLPIQCCTTVVPEYPLTIVEVSAPASFSEAFGLADEALAITAPFEVRRARAVARGMSASDFESRASIQPSEESLVEMAGHVIDNSVADDSLFDHLDRWIEARGITGLSEAHAER